MPADPAWLDVGPLPQEVDRGVDVLLAAPAEEVGVALARAFAAAVEEEHAVAVAREHARVRLGAAAAGERDHRGAVARRDVPAL